MYEAPETIEWDPHFVYPIHHAEHAKLDTKQRLAIQHFAEMAKRLVKKRDHFRSRLASLPRSAFGVRFQPDAEMQDEIFDQVHSFFSHLYDTLSALASVHGRIKVFTQDPSIKGVEAFLDWWSTGLPFLNQPESARVLRVGRDFRTVLAHPQQKAVFDWSTRSLVDVATIVIVLHGEQSSKGNVPEGATRMISDPTRWIFESPSMDSVIGALLTLTSLTFHTMPGTFPLPEGEERCTVEADGFGSAYLPRLAEQVRAAGMADPTVAHLLADS